MGHRARQLRCGSEKPGADTYNSRGGRTLRPDSEAAVAGAGSDKSAAIIADRVYVCLHSGAEGRCNRTGQQTSVTALLHKHQLRSGFSYKPDYCADIGTTEEPMSSN